MDIAEHVVVAAYLSINASFLTSTMLASEVFTPEEN